MYLPAFLKMVATSLSPLSLFSLHCFLIEINGILEEVAAGHTRREEEANPPFFFLPSRGTFTAANSSRPGAKHYLLGATT